MYLLSKAFSTCPSGPLVTDLICANMRGTETLVAFYLTNPLCFFHKSINNFLINLNYRERNNWEQHCCTSIHIPMKSQSIVQY